MCTPIFGILFYRIGLHSTLQYVFLRHWTSIILKVGSFQNSTDNSHTYCEKPVWLSSVQSSTKYWPLL